VYFVKEVMGMILTVVSELVTVEDAAATLPGCVCDPDGAEADAAVAELLEQVFP
jgi:hypothetical protein